tara:strand:- start:1438 stop:1629 length:192 start_codon:yes stop_codon:yes gene_type:complete
MKKYKAWIEIEDKHLEEIDQAIQWYMDDLREVRCLSIEEYKKSMEAIIQARGEFIKLYKKDEN